MKVAFATSETMKRTLGEGVELWQFTNTTEQNRTKVNGCGWVGLDSEFDGNVPLTLPYSLTN